MNYELAKELKDAGFPQIFVARTIYYIDGESSVDYVHNPHDLDTEDYIRVPTLSELIEACGDRFYSIVYATDNDWRAFSEIDGDFIDTANGSTPEEAVAKLWIELNKHD